MHWHIDIAVITIAGMDYYPCSVLDGYSRVVVQWDFLDRITEADIELILQRAREAADGAFHQDWNWPALGLTLDMVSDTKRDGGCQRHDRRADRSAARGL